MRCLTLADALKGHGAHTRFVSRHLPEYLRNKLAEKGHELALLETDKKNMVFDDLAHAPWLGVSQAQDGTDSIRVLSDEKWDWLIVDHYALDSRWEALLRKSVNKILVIDDLADRQHDCDVLLDQNLYTDMETRYLGKVPAHCQMLLGPCYALLRDEFRRLHKQVKPRTGPVKRMFVFFGGVDTNNYTSHVIKVLSQIDISNLHVDVIIGEQHPFRSQIEEECKKHNFFCHAQTDKMAELMAEADIAIGAGGSATWERCCLGLPTFAICTANNQQKQLEAAAQKGLLYLPEFTGTLAQMINKKAIELIENGYLRELISRNSMLTVNGCGVSLVLSNMGCNNVEVRMAILDDSEKVFNWRNHPSIREVSRNNSVITWQDHQQWFASIMADSKRPLLIGEDAEAPIGVVCFDVQNDKAEVSIYLIPEKASSGLGGNLLRSAELWLAEHHPKIRNIFAHVLSSNERSSKFFTREGYKMESVNYLKRLIKND